MWSAAACRRLGGAASPDAKSGGKPPHPTLGFACEYGSTVCTRGADPVQTVVVTCSIAPLRRASETKGQESTGNRFEGLSPGITQLLQIPFPITASLIPSRDKLRNAKKYRNSRTEERAKNYGSRTHRSEQKGGSQRRSQLGHGFVHGDIPRGRYRGAVFLHLEGVFCRRSSVVDGDQPGNRNVLSPASHAPRLPSSQVARIHAYRLRHTCARRRPDFLGRHAPNSSQIF